MDYRAYEYYGAHKIEENSIEYVRFNVWAPNAKEVYLTGDFNHWHDNNLPLEKIDNGNWIIKIKDVNEFDSYKYRIITWDNNVLYHSQSAFSRRTSRPKQVDKDKGIRYNVWWINRKNSTGIPRGRRTNMEPKEIGRASCRERV